MMKGKGSEYKDEAPQGEKYKLGSKKKGRNRYQLTKFLFLF